MRCVNFFTCFSNYNINKIDYFTYACRNLNIYICVYNYFIVSNIFIEL